MNEMVTIPREEYDRLRAAAEDLTDLQTYDRAKAALAEGEESGQMLAGQLVQQWLQRSH